MVPVVLLVLLAAAAPAAAQQSRPSLFAIDTVAAVDETAGPAGSYTTGVLFDSVVSVDLGGGFEALARPFVQRLATGEWNRQVWVAAIRYERRGAVGIRVDAGLIPSPIGLANLTLRPHLNPTIAQPSSLFTPLPPLDVRAPRTTLLGAIYPYGAQVTVAGRGWDARAALIDTSPLRARRVFARANPPRFANVVLGGGLTPFVGLRVGASITHGGWLQAGEHPLATDDRDATVATLEAEFAVAHTKVAAEWVRDAVETTTGPRAATGWFAHGHQTLAPRWFVSARVERMLAPDVPGLIGPQQLTGIEEVLGFRATPEITIRLGHRARRGFGRPATDHQGTVSLVWWRRWL